MRLRKTILVVSVLVPVLACRKAGESPTAADGAPGGAEAASTDELASLQQQLAGHRAELEAARTDVKRGEAVSTLPEDAPAARCSRVCDLSATICDLSERICALAEEHDDEPRYADACSAGQVDCERATEACDACSQ